MGSQVVELFVRQEVGLKSETIGCSALIKDAREGRLRKAFLEGYVMLLWRKLVIILYCSIRGAPPHAPPHVSSVDLGPIFGDAGTGRTQSGLI